MTSNSEAEAQRSSAQWREKLAEAQSMRAGLNGLGIGATLIVLHLVAVGLVHIDFYIILPFLRLWVVGLGFIAIGIALLIDRPRSVAKVERGLQEALAREAGVEHDVSMDER